MSDINYILKWSKRARKITITVKHDGEVVVTMPMRALEIFARRFAKQKESWIRATQEKFRKKFENKTPIKQSKRDYQEKKKEALGFVTERVEHFNTFYKFPYKSIKIKNQKSRWGSCSSKGNLNFNYSLISIPQELADYIVVHELCHLKELNHSQRFWNLVAQIMPDYKERRKKLKDSYIHIT